MKESRIQASSITAIGAAEVVATLNLPYFCALVNYVRNPSAGDISCFEICCVIDQTS